MGLSLADFLGIRSGAANEKDGIGKLPGSAGNGKAKSVIVLFCWGGISHLDSWDLKPDAPSEYRGTFNPI